MSVLTRAEDVAAEVKRRVETITVAQGSETNIGAAVYLGRRGEQIDSEMVPCTTVIEGNDNPATDMVRTQVRNAQKYMLFGFLPCDPLHPNVSAHAARRDLKRAMFKDGITWGGRVRRVSYLGREIAPRSDGAAVVLAAIEIEVEFVEDLAAP